MKHKCLNSNHEIINFGSIIKKLKNSNHGGV
jgi:hypothetical protein